MHFHVKQEAPIYLDFVLMGKHRTQPDFCLTFLKENLNDLQFFQCHAYCNFLEQ